MSPLFFFIVAVASVASATSDADTGCKLVQPVNASVCGVKGYFGVRGTTYQPQIVDSVEECAALCERRVYSTKHDQTYQKFHSNPHSFGWCRSFQFDKQTGLCQLRKNGIENYGYKSPKGPYVGYSSECYDCGKFCDQPYGANLLDNGGFEGQLLGPWESYGGGIGPGYKSSSAYCCAAGHYCELDQLFNMCPNNYYLLEFDFMNGQPAANETVSIYASLGPRSGFYPRFRFTNRVQIAQPWTSVRGFYQYLNGSSDEGPHFTIKNSQTERCIDNVRAVRVPAPIAVSGAKSLFVNGDFASGSLAPWTVRRNTVSPQDFMVVPGANSTYSLRYYADGLFKRSPHISQIVATKPNTTYLFSFDAQTVGNAFSFELVARLEGPDGSKVARSSQHMFLPNGTQTTATFPFFATTNSSNFTISLSSLADQELGKHATLLFRNCSLVEAEATPYY